MNTSVRNKRSPGQRSGLNVVWTIFVVTICGLGLIAFTKPSTIKQPDAVAQACQATMEEQLLATTPGDLAVMNDGYVVVLGAGGRPGVVYTDEIYYTTSEFGEHKRHLPVFVNNVKRIVKIGSPEYGGHASCFVLKKKVVEVNNTPMCQ